MRPGPGLPGGVLRGNGGPGEWCLAHRTPCPNGETRARVVESIASVGRGLLLNLRRCLFSDKQECRDLGAFLSGDTCHRLGLGMLLCLRRQSPRICELTK